jgi:hypothetical protein
MRGRHQEQQRISPETLRNDYKVAINVLQRKTARRVSTLQIISGTTFAAVTTALSGGISGFFSIPAGIGLIDGSAIPVKIYEYARRNEAIDLAYKPTRQNSTIEDTPLQQYVREAHTEWYHSRANRKARREARKVKREAKQYFLQYPSENVLLHPEEGPLPERRSLKQMFYHKIPPLRAA